MSAIEDSFTLIETQEDLQSFVNQHRSVEWVTFDTEFVGEKRYTTRLCLIQIGSVHGFFLIDPFPIKDFAPFLSLITDPGIIKITHAGENDYRLLNELFDIYPKNLFDTQLAAGFLGHRYPISFRKLVESELGTQLKKGYTVADWEARPFNEKQIAYAINDILPLEGLWQGMSRRLNDLGRSHWVAEELEEWESADYYAKDPFKEALSSNMMRSLNRRERLFLIRLFIWRQKVAKQKDYSKEMVLPSKLIGHIVRSMRSGREALYGNRRIPDKLVKKYGAEFEEMYKRPISAEEQKVLNQIKKEGNEDPREETLLEILYLVIKYRCIEESVAPNMVLPRNVLKIIKNEPEQAEELFGRGWRRELFGETFVEWLKNFDRLGLQMYGDHIELKLNG